MIQNTRLAKAAYWLAGELTRVKTYQQTYTWANADEFMEAEVGEDLPEMEMVKAGRMWLPCRLSIKLLTLSCDLDVKHWDHWALEHKLCQGTVCASCNGHVDDRNDDD